MSPPFIFKTMHESWLSNTYLVADRPGGHAVLIDTGGPLRPIVDKIEELRLDVSHILCTHHHYDHVAHNDDYSSRYGCPVCAHRSEVALFDHVDRSLKDGDEIASGDLRIRAIHIPGHTVGQLAFSVNDQCLFTGDTLFRGSVGGTRAPGHSSFDDIRHSIMDVLMRFPQGTAVHPGHCGPTTIGEEWRTNPFVLAWRRAKPPVGEPCVAFGQEAELLLRAEDYDKGSKCWVRFADGSLDIVPGSRVRE